MVKRSLPFLFLLSIATTLFAQQSWEGLATVGRFGRFPAGLYGASNLVPPNSLVSIRNLETGVSERIIITDGVSEPGVFLVLSPEAAALLDIRESGATRVRLTTIVTESTPINAATEQPFHPDPDINPAAELPDVEMVEAVAAGQQQTQPATETQVEPETHVAVSEPEAEPETEVAATVPETTTEAEPEPEPEPSEERESVEVPPVELAQEPAPELQVSTEAEQEPEPETQPETPAPSSPVQRSGIAAGIARTRVGQTQESFERPEATIAASTPEPVETRAVVSEPTVQPEETASVGLDQLMVAQADIPSTVVAPEPPAVEEPVPSPTQPEVSEPEGAIVEAAVPSSEAEVVRSNPIQDAIAAAVTRLPERDVFPPAVGDAGDLGFASLEVPPESSPAARLAEAVVPPVDRPELAGLGPLKAAVEDLPSELAIVSVPPEDLPDYLTLDGPSAPEETVGAGTLPVAQAEEEDRPSVVDLPAHRAPDQVLSPGDLVEAVVAPAETPSGDSVRMVSAPEQAVDATLAEALPADEEHAQLADIGRVDAPGDGAISAELATAVAGEEESAELTDIAPAGTPFTPGLDAELALATIAPEETPESALEEVFAPEGSPVEATLAEAVAEGVEIPETADVGSSEPTILPELDAVLAEASGPERPDGSLAGSDAPAEEDVAVAADLPAVGEEEAAMADTSIPPAEIPLDAILTLEPADFRPPEYPNPDEESILERESPAEEPAIVAVLGEPESAVAVEEIPEAGVIVEAPAVTEPEAEPSEPVVEEPAASEEPVERPEPVIVEAPATEPVISEPVTAVAAEPEPAESTTTEPEVVVSQPEVPVSIASLPVVADLQDENFYLQIGAYTAPASAQVAVDALSAAYPMAVQPVESRGRTVYRVLVGPLEQDETGTLLLWLRAKGYRETFIRSGREL